MAIADNSHIAVEPMFGQDYGQRIPNGPTGGHPSHQIAHKESATGQEMGFVNPEFRVKTTTSSQRTLRYNDFELVQKEAQNDAKYQLHVDEGDEKDSSRAGESQLGGPDKQSVAYPDIKMQRLYESKNGGVDPRLAAKKGVQSYTNHSGAPFGHHVRNSRHSLPKMALNQSI